MLDPRIYRTGLIAVVLAVIVLAFSLYDQEGPLGTSLAPDAFSGANAFATMNRLAAAFPHRRPGSVADEAIARIVSHRFHHYGFAVSTNTFRAQTAAGERTLKTVMGIRAGVSTGSIVVVAHRDSLRSPGTADASGTAVLLDLARALSGETQQRTVILASTSGSAGAAGAAQLARTLPGPVDAVIVLGDVAGAEVSGPVLVPWSNAQVVAPSRLRNTLSQSLTGQAALSPGTPSLAGQFAHLAFPMAASEQAPFGAHHEPAVLVSASGERGPGANEPTSLARIGSLGRVVLQSVNALGGGPEVPAPSSYLELGGKLIPGWAVRLLVLALMIPVLMTTIDGVARARRRGHRLLRWTAWVLAAALPFALVEAVVVLARLAGLIGAAPSGPVGAGAVPLRGGGIATLAIGACVLAGGFLALRPLVIRLARLKGSSAGTALPSAGGSAALLLVLCVCSLAIWVSNPFAAALLVPALHMWLWAVAPELRLRPAVLAALLLAGLAAPALTAVYYAVTLGLDPLHAVWNGVLLLGGGTVGPLAALEWSMVLGCAVSATVIAIRSARQPRPEDLPVTIRGPVGYAGPGSLGGTESALRR